MTQVGRFDGDVRITGTLQVDGSMPTYERSELQQDNNEIYVVPLVNLRTWDAIATNLPGTSATDDLALSGGTFGTNSPKITTGDVKNTTSITRYARFSFELPPEYVDGETVTIRLHAGMTTTVASSSATVDVECYKSDDEGAVGSDLCTTAATTINSLTKADKDFVITPTGLTAGDTLDVRITVTVADVGTGTAVIADIGAIHVLLDIKG